jgi:hypothetical protein
VEIPFEQEAIGKKQKGRTTTSLPAAGRGKKIGTSQKLLATKESTHLNKGKITEREPPSEGGETEAEDTDVEKTNGEGTEVNG